MTRTGLEAWNWWDTGAEASVSPRNRGRVAEWDTDAEANERQTYRDFTPVLRAYAACLRPAFQLSRATKRQICLLTRAFEGGSPGNRTLNLRIKRVFGRDLGTCGFGPISALTWAFGSATLRAVEHHFRLSRGFFVGLISGSSRALSFEIVRRQVVKAEPLGP